MIVRDRSQPWACGDVFGPQGAGIRYQNTSQILILHRFEKKKGPDVTSWDGPAVWQQGILGQYIETHTKHRAHDPSQGCVYVGSAALYWWPKAYRTIYLPHTKHREAH